MASILGYTLIFILAYIKVLVSGADDVSEKFKESGIVPKIIPVAPTKLLGVVYPGDVRIILGNDVVAIQTLIAPSVDFRSEPDSFYTLAMIEPAAAFAAVKGRTKSWFEPGSAFEFLHWLVGNIPGDDVEQGETMASYFPPVPPPLIDPDYYIFLVYKQPGRITFNRTILDFAREQLRVFVSISDIASKNGLGDPIFGCFCHAKLLPIPGL